MPVHIERTQRQGLDVWVLENECLHVTLLPSPGGKLVSLYDKRRGVEWLAPPSLPPQPVLSYGAAWNGPGSYGWDEMMPTIVACPYPGPGNAVGVALPDHGELWTEQWQSEVTGERISLRVAGRALPYTFERTTSIDAEDVLVLDYAVRNQGAASLVYLWAAHPLFWCEAGTEIVLPPQITQVVNVLGAEWGEEFGPPGQLNPWPAKLTDNGLLYMNRIGTIAQRAGRKFYVPPEQRVEWAGLWRPSVQAGLQVSWQSDQNPYLGIWVDEGALYPRSGVVALEPTNSYYDNLAAAAAVGRVPLLPPGEMHCWQLCVRTGDSRPPFVGELTS